MKKTYFNRKKFEKEMKKDIKKHPPKSEPARDEVFDEINDSEYNANEENTKKKGGKQKRDGTHGVFHKRSPLGHVTPIIAQVLKKGQGQIKTTSELVVFSDPRRVITC